MPSLASILSGQSAEGMADGAELASASELDREQAFIGALDAGQQYLESLEQLSRELKAGFFSLAQAKYSAGPGKIGQLQYPATMRATLRAPAEEASWRSRQQADSTRETVSGVEPASSTADFSKPDAQAEGQTSKTANGNSLGFQGVLGELAQQFGCLAADDEHTGVEPSEVKDPLSWFGVMLPASLRDAQKHFKAAADLSLLLSQKRADILAQVSAFSVSVLEHKRTPADSGQ